MEGEPGRATYTNGYKLLTSAALRFVVTLLHPLFFTNNATRSLEVEENANGERFTVRAIKVKEYLTEKSHKAGLYLPKASTGDVQVIGETDARLHGTDQSYRLCTIDLYMRY